MESELMEIGLFSTTSGLSIAALRHYDEVGILKPQVVDERTAYRRYHPDQLEEARLICSLRGVDLPLDAIREYLAVRADGSRTKQILLGHQRRLADRADRLELMIARSQTYVDEGLPVPPLASSRVVQVMIKTTDLDASIAFYREVFGLTGYNPDIVSFVLGAYDTDSFLLLTIENWLDDDGPSCFGMLVGDVDAVHRRALELGAKEISAPADYAWKPRSSVIDDPSGNRIQLAQG
jgi:DNA-binding transcriptional MerR regulator